MNLWTHLHDETTPACVREYIESIQKLRRENPGLMMHTKWRTVFTAFYQEETEQWMIRRGEENFVPDAPYYTAAVYDSSGYRVRIDLYANNQHLLRKEYDCTSGLSTCVELPADPDSRCGA